MRAYSLTFEENKSLRWYINRTEWLSERASSGDDDAVKKLQDTISARYKLECNIKNRLAINFTAPLSFGDGVCYVTKE